MEDLIKREDAINLLWYFQDECCSAVVGDFEKLPSADRLQGEWIDKGDYAVCSNCGTYSGTQFDGVEPVPRKTNFCPNCGCRMKGANDE